MKQFSWRRVGLWVGVLLTVSIVVAFSLSRVGHDTLDWDVLLTHIEDDEIVGAVLKNDHVVVKRIDDPPGLTWRVFYPAAESTTATPMLTEALRASAARRGERIGIQGVKSPINIGIYLMLALVLLIGISVFTAFRRSGKNMAKRVDPDQLPSLQSVAGIAHAHEEVQDILSYLRDPERFKTLGARMPRGVLLEGPPGTGKTLLAKALACEADIPFFALSGSDFVEMFVGVGARRVRAAFKEARLFDRAIIFIDEIDAIARKRSLSVDTGSNSEQEHALNAILVEMDGFTDSSHILVVGATNRSDILDPALLRPGRFDRRIRIDLPTLEDRAHILGLHAKNKPIDDDVAWEHWASLTAGMSGADLENLVNEASVIAARNQAKNITHDHMQTAWTRSLTGIQNKRPLSADTRKRIGVHEMGHALAMAAQSTTRDRLTRVSILGSGTTLGATIRAGTDEPLLSESDVWAEIRILIAGITAEHTIYGEISNGGSDDLQRAGSLIRRAVTVWGMGGNDMLLPAVSSPNEQCDMLSQHSLEMIDTICREVLKSAQEEVHIFLTKHWKNCSSSLNDLVKHNELSGDVVREIVSVDGLPEKPISVVISSCREALADFPRPMGSL